jgi:queuine tRNA-ribosyltransferase
MKAASPFALIATDGAARRGRLTTAHGVVETPVFMPVGTRGTVKGLGPDDLRDAGVSIVLGNTYHLFVKPGHALIQELGGLHRFMAWDRPILTDSGGFQVFSLAKVRTITEEGARFRSPVDGREHMLTPELAVEVQLALGADVIHPLDECLGYPATPDATERSLALTMRWARRSLAAHQRAGAPCLIFGIAQGGTDPALRQRAADEIASLGFDGHAIGGLAVGEPKPLMYDLTELTATRLPGDRVRYLMGVGKPEDLVESVARGIDMFDCVLPTRNARNGQAFTTEGPLTIKQARFANDGAPLDAGCPCYTCRTFSRAYLRHLFMASELLVFRLLSLHNVHFFAGLMAAMREAIARGEFGAFRARFFSRYVVSSAEIPLD